jgi:hypothetical protein|tara:strand:+ start:60 stop:1163 length:1104 start_codon:yes stop_codon:yes gene_type:complete
MLSQYDQSVRDAGYKYVPQSQYLLDPFKIPGDGSVENDTFRQPTGIASLGGGGGGGGFNPYNADMSQIRQDYSPFAYRQAMASSGAGIPSGILSDSKFLYAPESKISGLINFIPGVGTISRIGNFLKDKLPINQRAILENQLRGSGVLTDDIGRIVAAPGQYNTPEGIMAGYNAAQMTDATFDKRTGNIADTLSDKYGFTAADIANLNAGIITPEMEQKAYNPTMRKTSNLLTNYININKAKINFNRKQKEADDIVAFREKQRAFDDARNARDRDNDGVPDYVEDAGGSYDGGYHGAEGGFENTGGGGGGFAGQGSGASGPAGGQSSGGNYGGGSYGGYGGGADRFMDGGRVYYMDGGLADLVDIYD